MVGLRNNQNDGSVKIKVLRMGEGENFLQSVVAGQVRYIAIGTALHDGSYPRNRRNRSKSPCELESTLYHIFYTEPEAGK